MHGVDWDPLKGKKTEIIFALGRGQGKGWTADLYTTDTLLEHVLYAGFIGYNFILMHDNARCRTSPTIRNILNEILIRTMDWPAINFLLLLPLT